MKSKRSNSKSLATSEEVDISIVGWRETFTAWKVSKYGVFSGPYFPAFGLNMERYFVSLRIQSECWKIRTSKSSVFRHFSRSDYERNLDEVINSSYETINSNIDNQKSGKQKQFAKDFIIVYVLFYAQCYGKGSKTLFDCFAKRVLFLYFL